MIDELENPSTIQAEKVAQEKEIQSERGLKELFEGMDFKKIEFKKMSELLCWDRFDGFDLAEKMNELEIVVIDDEEKWKEIYGSNDSKSSHSPKTIILKKEIFDRTDISVDDLGWLVHEMGHVNFYENLGEKVEQYMQEYHEKGEYTDSEMEKQAFESQFQFLKSLGESRVDCMLMMEKYFSQSFDKTQVNEENKEFEKIKEYLENVFPFENEEERVEFEQYLADRALFNDKSILDESYPESDPRRWTRLAESEIEGAITQYFDNLGLNKKMLSEKENILDIGAHTLDFSAFCLKEKINEHVVSLEPALDISPGTGYMEAVKLYWGEEIYSQVLNMKVSGVMEQLPFKNDTFDLIVDHCAFPGFNYAHAEIEQMKEGVERSFDEIIRVLKAGGEARLFPFVTEGKLDERLSSWRPAVEKKLEEIANSGICSVFIEDVLNLETGQLMEGKRLILKKTL